MDHLDPVATAFDEFPQLVGDEYAPVPSAGTAHADHQLALPFLDILGQQELDQGKQPLLEFPVTGFSWM